MNIFGAVLHPNSHTWRLFDRGYLYAYPALKSNILDSRNIFDFFSIFDKSNIFDLSNILDFYCPLRIKSTRKSNRLDLSNIFDF